MRKVSLFKTLLLQLGILLSGALPGHAEGDYIVSNRVRRVYDLAFEFRIEEARSSVAELRRSEPNNLLAVLLEDYLDFMVLFASEDQNKYRALREVRSERLEELKGGRQDSPYYMFSRAEIYLHWAILKFRYEEYFSAALDLNRAFRLLEKNAERFPDFAPNLKSLGILKAGVGTIPDKYMWAVRFFSSLDGSIPEGMNDLRRSLELAGSSGMFQEKEARILYAQALFHFSNDSEAAWGYLQRCDLDPGDNLFDCFVISNMAIKTGRNDEAIALLENRPRRRGLLEIPYMDLMLGRSRLHRLDGDADVPLARFIRATAGPSYIKESYQKLAWFSLLNGNKTGYLDYIDSCRVYGNTVTDEDASAMKEAEGTTVPHRGLLGARLLFDGGYYSKSLARLTAVDQSTLNSDQQLEWEYRYGRVLHEMGRVEEALQKYDRTIALGSDSPRYYACNAALKCAELYEQQRDYDRAADYFSLCLKLKPDEYQASIHQKAKAGLLRIDGLY